MKETFQNCVYLYCKWDDKRCYNQSFVGDYDENDGQRYWNYLAKVKRHCGVNIKYRRTIYCDGELVAISESETSYLGQGKLRIGMTGPGWNQIGGFKGQIDDVRIWNVAKTQDH
ncbi:hypothetical protein MHK_000384 [Candidatus Magnetomorum sp. HK-1]|nr:hypothetical protein MHK_000384 [Candidatus Magnetomorum sp. HK-1]